MGDTVIKVEGLSKQYTITAAKHRHDTLRDVLMDGVRSIYQRGIHRSASGTRRQASTEEVWALRDASFEVKRGEVLGLIGRNGAGKSTLLKLLSRITEPTSGRAMIYGRVGSLLEVGTGFDRELSGRENVYLNGAILGMTKREIDRKFDQIVDFAGVEKFIDTPVKRYSSGMYVRLGFAVAAHLEPEILIVDEVLAVGDAAFQQKCLTKMRDAMNEGRTVLFVSHNMGSVAALTTRCIMLDAGQIVRDGSVSETIAAYLNLSDQQSAKWEATAVTDQPMQILRIGVSSDSQLSGGSVFDVCHEVEIEIEYVVRKFVRNAVLATNIYAQDGAHLVSLEDTDQEPELLLGRQPGKYVASVTLPERWLNSGSYSLRIDCGELGGGSWHWVDQVSFQLMETGDLQTRGHRKGYLLPMLRWRMRPVLEATEAGAGIE